MKTDQSPKDIERLLAEANELAQRINADVLNEMEEEHRLQFEIHAQELERIKAKVQDRTDKKKTSKSGSAAEGIHEAILDIVKAMHELKKVLS
ncbi:MAG: hypothetical protein P8010_15090 [Desulfosarcinaceae bacterium]